MFEKILMKYRLLQIRGKLSFMAFEKCITIQELILRAILRAILKTYYELVKEGVIKPELSRKFHI